MLARIRKSMEEKDQGFTLIELLVVIIIIGILAAIAIPVFLNQRKKATESSMKSDLRTIATELETRYTDTQAYPATGVTQAGQVVTVGTGGSTVRVSDPQSAVVYAGPASSAAVAADSFCLTISNPKVTDPVAVSWVYDSDRGGLVKDTDCAH